jgi:enterochelin esterase-like enzyme
MRPFLLSVLALCLLAPAFSESPEAPLSPELRADRKLTFRLLAPSASQVKVSGDFGDFAMAKDARGLWSVSTASLAPAIYRYSFIVDGVQMADPGNPDIKGTRESIVTVPGDPPMPWESREVPHGRLVQILYRSESFGADRRYVVYTPPAFDAGAERLPVLFLLHGYTDDDSTWTSVGKANLIADNLLAEGKIGPMLIVMPYGQLDSRVPMGDALAGEFQRKYERQILAEIMPEVEKSFRAAREPGRRAIAGQSMGGFQAALFGLNHPETFSTVGMWSSAFFGDPPALLPALVAAPEGLKRSFRYVSVNVGREDELAFCSAALDRFLSSQRIVHDFRQTPGAHSWLVWRPYLADFLQKFSAVAK